MALRQLVGVLVALTAFGASAGELLRYAPPAVAEDGWVTVRVHTDSTQLTLLEAESLIKGVAVVGLEIERGSEILWATAELRDPEGELLRRQVLGAPLPASEVLIELDWADGRGHSDRAGVYLRGSDGLELRNGDGLDFEVAGESLARSYRCTTEQELVLETDHPATGTHTLAVGSGPISALALTDRLTVEYWDGSLSVARQHGALLRCMLLGRDGLPSVVGWGQLP